MWAIGAIRASDLDVDTTKTGHADMKSRTSSYLDRNGTEGREGKNGDDTVVG